MALRGVLGEEEVAFPLMAGAMRVRRGGSDARMDKLFRESLCWHKRYRLWRVSVTPLLKGALPQSVRDQGSRSIS
ncbi:hypothetical protein EVAR_37059_1 [Eumeta japonica]|uniref:Uncharacterized protein n=1 Tax=Eumeta variegata TaxID=151549 RepID=A0A4C1WIL3_EUMVA|nr:hypothetical protein EVAR_37059_1 [Eumeta japonica]